MINRDEMPEIPGNAEWNTPSGAAPEPTPAPEPVKESRAALTSRLKREGRWNLALLWRDTEVDKLRKKGWSKEDANQLAWEAVADEFSPAPHLEKETAAAKEAKPPDIGVMLEAAEGDQMPPDLIRDILWCYENLNRKVEPESAPSGGAWGLLQWARNYRVKFFETLVPKALASRPPADEENQRAERKSVAEIRKIIETYGKGK